jgi:ribosomal protein L37E
METAVTEMQFKMESCRRCGRRTVHAFKAEQPICAVCEPGAFERAALEAGRREFLR